MYASVFLRLIKLNSKCIQTLYACIQVCASISRPSEATESIPLFPADEVRLRSFSADVPGIVRTRANPGKVLVNFTWLLASTAVKLACM